jgi:hypothetical protein
MRLPACLEQEIFEFAQKRMAQINNQSSTEVDTSPSTIHPSALAQVETTKQKTIKLELWLRVENNNKFIRRKKKVRERIEFWCLSQYNYHKPKQDGWDYELTIPYETEEELECKIDELYREMSDIADTDYCFIEVDLIEVGTDRSW